ncbi:Uma2 family endonuclease [Kitasatospora sp. NPDC054939]
MSALPHGYAEPPQFPDYDLLEAFLALDTPEGYKAELIEGEIIVAPPPNGEHETMIGRIVWQIASHCPEGIDFAATKGLIVPDGRYIPDGTFAKEGALLHAGPWAEPDGVLMVLEVTSGRAATDRVTKRKGYAAAGIPLYLLVDRRWNRVILHLEPANGDYGSTDEVAIGEPLALPEPFGFELATDRLG